MSPNSSQQAVNWWESDGPTRMDHLDAVLDSDLDNLVACEISPHGGVLTSLANDVGFVGLYNRG